MAATKCIALLLLAMAAVGTHGLDFVVTNSDESSDGGKRFDNEIGRTQAKQIMDAASQFIWQTFAQQSSADRKNVQKVTLFVESMSGVAYTKTGNNEIHLSAEYVANYQGDVKNEITGVLYHEVTHVWQWFGNGATTITLFVESMSGVAYTNTGNNEIHLSAEYVANYQGDVKNEITGVLYHEVTHVWQWFGNGAPSGLTEGIADYVRLTAGFAPSHWVKPGSGDKWDQGYDVTAYFLQYCDSVTSGFVAKMNSKLRDGWNLGFFNDITGKSVDELWSDYKAKYANSS